jgi:transposase
MEPEYIGVDLHKQFFQVCALGGDGERHWESRFPRTEGGLAAFGHRCGPSTRIAVEACGPTWPFVDALTPTGAVITVVDPRKTRLKAGYAAKTDRLDARRLADALRRASVVGIYVPPPAIREVRELCRGRHQLIQVRTRVCQMIRALLLRNGAADVPLTRVYSAAGQQWLATVVLPRGADETAQRLRQVLAAVHRDAQAADAAVRARAQADPIAGALATMVGIGPVLALSIRAEVGDIGRFAHGAQLASYAGLVPRVDASADRYRTGRITRQGSPWLRWALVTAAMHTTRRTDRTGRWARRLAVRKGALKARVACARVLCDEIVTVWKRVSA